MSYYLNNLTLSKEASKSSIFMNGTKHIPMREHTNMLKAVGFIQNRMGNSIHASSRHQGMETFTTELQMVQAYHNRYDRPKESYSISHSLSKLKWGRTIPVDYLSLSIMPRQTRHGFCEGIYADKDMVSAHVAFVCELFKDKPNVDISAMVEYNRDPKMWRAAIAQHHGLDPIKNKDDTKQLFIRILFGGSYEQWIKDFDIQENILSSQQHPLVLKIENQLGVVRDEFYAANPQMVKDLKKHEPVKYANLNQLKRSLLAFALQTIERWIMESCVSFLVCEKKFDIHDIVPCQDGLMILKNLDYPEIERDFERITMETFGLNILWVDKPFDEAIEIPDGIISRTIGEWEELLTDEGISQLVKRTCGDRIQYKRASEDSRDFLYVFDSVKRRWFLEDSKNTPTLMNIIRDMYSIIKRELDLDESLTNNERKRLTSRSMSLLMDSSGHSGILKRFLCIAEWSGIEFDSCPHLLGFENGYLDLRYNEFAEYSEDVHMTVSTGYNHRFPNYDSPEDALLREEVVSVFGNMFDTPEDLLYFMQIMASGLDGINYQKIWFFKGVGGNGKSLGLSLNESVLGHRLYKSASGGILAADAQKANAASEDMMLLKNGRTVVFMEMDKGEGMQWTVLKVLTGGDTITARALYKGVEQFNLNASIICAFNNKPDFVGSVSGPEKASLERRLRPVEFPSIFTDDEAKLALGGKYKRANNRFSSPEWKLAVRHVYLDLLCGIYKAAFNSGLGCLEFDEPISVKLACSEYLKDEDLFNEVFNELYVAVPESKNPITLGDIYADITYSQQYKMGASAKGGKAFARVWSKKAFSVWSGDRHGINTDRKGQRYIVGFVLKTSLHDTVDVGDTDNEY